MFWILESSAESFGDTWEPVTVEEKCAYARGYFDAEGGVPRSTTSRFYIQLVQKDLDDLTTLRTILLDLGIACGALHNPSVSADPDLWRFYVRTSSHADFIERVGSWHPRKRSLLESRSRAIRMKIESTPRGDTRSHVNKVAVAEAAAGSPPF
jgi:hypothetical protein